jgi:hypothetical protein
VLHSVQEIVALGLKMAAIETFSGVFSECTQHVRSVLTLPTNEWFSSSPHSSGPTVVHLRL